MKNAIIGRLVTTVVILPSALLLTACLARQQSANPASLTSPGNLPIPASATPPASGAAPTITIAWPLNGARVKIGQPFQVHAIAVDPRGIYSIGVGVDGQALAPAIAAPPLVALSAAITVTLESKGVHVIAVRANSTTGAKSEPATIKVVAVQTLSDPADAGEPPTPAPQAAVNSASAGAVDQLPPPPNSSVNFAARPSSISPEQCSTLRWDVDGVREVYFEGAGVAGHDEKSQCPTQTTTYTLRVVFADGQARDYTATVTVTDGSSSTITSATARLEPSSYSGPCPGTVKFVGEITSSGPGSFTVVWVRGGAANQVSPAVGITFARAETKTVSWDSQVTATGQYPVRLDVFNPDQSAAARADAGTLSVNCRAGFAVTAVVATANRSTYTGPCPNTLTAGAKMTANGPGTVKYRWERSDGTQSDLRTLAFEAAGEKSVTNYDWRISSSGSYWMRVHILEPNDLSSNKGEAVFTCASAYRVTNVAASIDPLIYSGACPKTVNYSGVITTDGPGTVTYKWIRSDGEGAARTIAFNAAGSQTVTSSDVTYDRSGTYWAKLQVTAPNEMTSTQAKLTVNCAPSFSVSLASASINPTGFTGTCPHTFHYTGVIRSTGAGTVTYRWERSDGNGDTRTIQFSQAGDQTVTSGDVRSGSSGTYWARLHVLTPNDRQSNQATFTLTCK